MKIICILANLSQPRCIKRVKSLQEGGHDVSVYGFCRGLYDVNEFPSSIKVNNWGKIESGTGYLSRLCKVYKNLKTIFRKHKDESVIYYCFSFEAALITSLFTKRKFFYEISDLIYCYSNSQVFKWLFGNIDKFIIRRSFRTVLTSGGFFEYLYKKDVESNNEKIIIQPNKLSTYFQDIERTILKRESHFRFAYIGAFRYPNTIFRFARIIGEKFPNHEFSFYGDSSLTYLAKELAEKYPNVHYYGKFKNPEELSSIYENVDIVTACYDIEMGENEKVAEPNKLYEAMAFCKPIIVSKDTYLSKRVEKLGVGFSIDANNDDSIIDFITGLSVDELKKKSLNSYKLPKTEFIDSPDLILSSLCKNY